MTPQEVQVQVQRARRSEHGPTGAECGTAPHSQLLAAAGRVGGWVGGGRRDGRERVKANVD